MTSEEEFLILVDETDHAIGYESKRRCHQNGGMLHRAFSILLFNEQKQLLIQKRSHKKLLWPLYWSNSVCSHPRKDESYEIAATRRLSEELQCEAELVFLFKFRYQAMFDKISAENEICAVYIGKVQGQIVANPDEIAAWKYITLEELNRSLLTDAALYTPWFQMEWEHIRQFYRHAIHKL